MLHNEHITLFTILLECGLVWRSYNEVVSHDEWYGAEEVETEPDESLYEAVDGHKADPAPAVDPVRRLDQRKRQH